ncbi:MAG: thioredoxin-dependent thiol peroxidase [FCB group bacterium]|nr:thioredoxin-dependent thiol peroxidase [FCB group bacterium]
MAEIYTGDKAPDFKLESSAGDTVALSDFKGRIVVLYFYPKDNTSGCRTEACGFRDLQGDFEKAGAVILGISPDSIKSHHNFIGKHELNFPLLSDPDKLAAEAYGVWVKKKNYGREYMGIERSTFIVGKDGSLAHVFRKVKVDGHMDQILEIVRGMQ